MFMIGVDYPSRDEEIAIVRSTTGMTLPRLSHVIDGDRLIAFQDLVRRVPVPDHLYEFAVDLARRTRPGTKEAPGWIKPLVNWGAGPRAAQYLILGAKARAALHGSYVVRLEDIVQVADPVMRHRLVTTFTAQSEGVTSRELTKRLLEELSKAA
jgi:MoxR-like ATPase